MMANPPTPMVYVDFQNGDEKGRVRLNTVGTLRDLARQQVQLRSGMVLTLYSDDADEAGGADELRVLGVVEHSEEEGCWVAAIDWAKVGHASDEQSQAGRASAPRAAS